MPTTIPARRLSRLIKENHPDKLIADGMLGDFIDVATAKMATIEMLVKIQKQRGLK